MKKEVKAIFQLLLLVLPLFGITVFGWFNSPMYADAIEKNRLDAQIYLMKKYYYSPYLKNECQAIMERFGFTEEDIKPYLGGLK